MKDLASLMEALKLEYDAADLDRDDLVEILCSIRDVRAELATFAKEVEQDLLARAGEKRWVVDGLGEVTVRKQTKRSEWDNDGLTRKLVALALDERIVDESTGEYEPGWEAVARVLSECARPSWRVTPLRARGIDETEYCIVTPDGWAIELPPKRG